MTIDKQKLLQWIEDKKFVFAEPYVNENEEILCKGSLSVLNALDRAIELGEFKQENGEEVKV